MVKTKNHELISGRWIMQSLKSGNCLLAVLAAALILLVVAPVGAQEEIGALYGSVREEVISPRPTPFLRVLRS